MSNLYCYYRISDNFQKTITDDGTNIIKKKPSYITKENCLKNFIDNFGNKDITIIADNVGEKLMKTIKSFIPQEQIIITSYGHGAGSFRKSLELSLSLPDNKYVYYVEDDYLHKNNSKEILLEGLRIADYVSLYDHPDKYINANEIKDNCQGNPKIVDNSEETRVYLTDTTHWKQTNSTTMTFATNIKTLKEDYIEILKYCSGTFPYDYYMFRDLIDNKKRKLITSIPGYSTHGETYFLSPLTNWESI